MKKAAVMLLCLALLLTAAACQKTHEKPEAVNEEKDSGTVQPLTVYYISQSYFQGTAYMMGWYQRQEGAYPIDSTVFTSAEELQAALEEGFPDILLLDKVSSSVLVDPYEWIREGKIAGLSIYMEQDENLDSENYIRGTLEAGRFGGEQYILPLSVSSSYLLINEAERETGSLSALGGEFSVQQLMEVLLQDAEQHRGNETYFTHLPYYMTISNWNQWLYEMLEQTGALHVDRDSRTVQVDEALFEQTVRYFRSVFEDASALYSGETDLSSGSLADIEAFTTVMLSGNNAAFMARYMSSSCHQLMDQDMYLVPYELAGGGYSVNVNVFGMVGADSDQPEAAYQVLRTVMDMPCSSWETIGADDAFAQMSPVRVIEALGLVDAYAQLEGGNFRIAGSLVQREKLTEELAETLRSMIQENRQAFLVDAGTCQVMTEYLGPYVMGETEDLSGTAQQTAAAIEAGMKE